jgi:hypothetical protein
MSASHLSDWLYCWWGWVVRLPKHEATSVITAYHRILLGFEDSVENVEFSLLGPGISCEVIFFEALRNGSSIRATISRLLSEMHIDTPSEERVAFEKHASELVIRRIGSLLAELEHRVRNEIKATRIANAKSDVS